MALFRIQHHTSYHYSQPVFIEPHFILLKPRSDWRQELRSFQLQVDPAPAGLSWGFDVFGNERAQVWFHGMHPALHVRVEAEVQTLAPNPFDYLVQAAASESGLHQGAVFAPYLQLQSPAPAADDLLEQLLMELDADPDDVPRFLSALNLALGERVTNITRLEPGVLAPETLLSQGRGACRDLAAAFMEACRRRTIPARYVSGYQTGDPECDEGDLHAWAEAYVPGGGWRGFDPTHRLVVADQHIVVAAGAAPEHTAPLAGSFRGTGVQARLEHSVRLIVKDGDV